MRQLRVGDPAGLKRQADPAVRTALRDRTDRVKAARHSVRKARQIARHAITRTELVPATQAEAEGIRREIAPVTPARTVPGT